MKETNQVTGETRRDLPKLINRVGGSKNPRPPTPPYVRIIIRYLNNLSSYVRISWLRSFRPHYNDILLSFD